MDAISVDVNPVDEKPPEPEFAILPALPDAPILDAGDVLAYLKAAGIAVSGDAVMTRSDGTVAVAAVDDKALAQAWASFVPAEPPPSPLDALTEVKDLDGIKAWLAEHWNG